MRDHRVTVYLQGLSRLCAEVARDPRLLPILIGLLKRAPRTIAELARAERMAA